MSTYNNYRFTPGNKGNLRLYINKEYIRQTQNANYTNTKNPININEVYNSLVEDFLFN